MPTPPRLPEVGHDEDNWGTILNEYLEVSHNADGTQKATVLSYKVFLTQTSTNAPTVASLLKDDISGLVWSYSSIGTYLLTKTGAFIVNKTVPSLPEAYTDYLGNYMTLERTSADVMTLKTYAAVNTTVLSDDVIANQFINIEVYL